MTIRFHFRSALTALSILTLLATSACGGGNRTNGSTVAGGDAAPGEASPNAAIMVVHGMGCPQCAYNVDRQLLMVEGVEAVNVDMGTGTVTATLSPSDPPAREELVTAIEETGFTLVSIDMPNE